VHYVDIAPDALVKSTLRTYTVRFVKPLNSGAGDVDEMLPQPPPGPNP
jgi:hypothetical protein